MIVFLLGIPGCGKSELFRRVTARLENEGVFREFKRVDDFPKLWNIFQEDKKSGDWKRSRPTPDGGYKVIDNNVWDDILKEVNRDVLSIIGEMPSGMLLFIEFSRPNYVHSINSNFSKEVMDQAVGVYLDVPFDICWERNVRRHEKAIAAGGDDHLVSREEMEETYGSDDKNELETDLPFPVVFIKNDSSDPDDFVKLDEGVDRLVSVVKETAKK